MYCRGVYNFTTGERLTCKCPALYKASKGDRVGGWIFNETLGMALRIVSPNATGRELDAFTPYCLATRNAKKLANPADWSGRAPKWCPRKNTERGTEHRS